MRVLFSGKNATIWYSDIWVDVKGTGQNLSDKLSRLRSAAFPFELAYRLINMYSVRNDVVLDPFLGTGTTVAAAMASNRNSIGVEIDNGLWNSIGSVTDQITGFSNTYLLERLQRHFAFVEHRKKNEKPLRYINAPHGCPVVTSQEQHIILNTLTNLRDCNSMDYEVEYSERPTGGLCYSNWSANPHEYSEGNPDKPKRSPSTQLDLLKSN